MIAGMTAFLFGLLAGFVMLRLGANKSLAGWERKLLRPLGLILMGASFALAIALVGWALIGIQAGLQS
jgi:hypothetical protein